MGAGNRSGFRDCLKWLAETDPKWVESNLSSIPEYGRWDDLRELFGTPLEKIAAKIWGDAILEKNALAAKWADRSDKPILKYLRGNGSLKDIGEFRRLLAKIRKEHIVEHKMCTNNWEQIEYPKVPSVAMNRYTKAFNEHDKERFESFKTKVEKGETKINAGVLFPHDLARLVRNGDKKIADLQFDALPDYIGGTDNRIMVIVDSSSSMSCGNMGGDVQPIDVSTSLGLYCSDRLGKENPFYRKFMQFASESKLSTWEGMSFSQCYSKEIGPYGEMDGGLFDGAIGSTRIDKALNSILNHAKMFNATDEQIPNVLLIISDMQFHEGSSGGSGTEVNNCIDKWVEAGYSRPKVVYWNVSPYAGSPELSDSNDVGLVSGFSPSILKAVLSCEDFTPRGIMLRAVEKYHINTPQ